MFFFYFYAKYLPLYKRKKRKLTKKNECRKIKKIAFTLINITTILIVYT